MNSSNGCNDIDLIQDFKSNHRAVAAAQRQLFRSIAVCDRKEVWRRDGCRDMGQWVSGRVGISNWAANRWVHAAHALEYLPGIAAAFERGTLSLDKVVELARFASAETEDDLIQWAKRVSVACIRRKADVANRPSLEDVKEADETRYLKHWWFDEGRRFGLEGSWPADQGAVIQKALDRLAERIPAMPDDTKPEADPFDDGIDARRAGALLLLASGQIADDPTPTGRRLSSTPISVPLRETMGPVASKTGPSFTLRSPSGCAAMPASRSCSTTMLGKP